MEEMKQARKHFSKLGGAFLVGTLVILGVQVGVSKLVGIYKPEWLADINISILLSAGSMYLVGMTVLIALVKRLPAQTPEKHSIKKSSFFVAAILCFGLVYMSNFLGTILTTIISRLKGGLVQNVIQDVATSASLWVVILYMVIAAPIMEEYVFRKLIVDRTLRYGQGVAILVSGLMFGLFHGNLNQFVYAFTLGMFLAFLYVKTGNIKITIALHMMINFVGGALSSLIVKNIDMVEYQQVMGSADIKLILEYVTKNAAPLLGLLALGFFVICVVIASIVLFIISIVDKKFSVAPGEIVIPKGKRFTTVILNWGMILFSVFWLAEIILQLFE